MGRDEYFNTIDAGSARIVEDLELTTEEDKAEAKESEFNSLCHSLPTDFLSMLKINNVEFDPSRVISSDDYGKHNFKKIEVIFKELDLGIQYTKL